jgi:Ca-activated chloride channel homolog
MRRLLKLGVICSLQLFLTVVVVRPAGAQAPNGSSSATPPAAPQAGPPVPKNEIRVRTNEVIVPVTILDGQHEPVIDLSKADFHIFDGGVEQKIDRWDLDGDPLAVALLIETSTHIKSMMPTIHRLASVFTENIMALDGEAAVITYDSDVNVWQPFTEDHDLIENAIAKVRFEVPETQLYDGMARGVALLKEQPPSRHRVLLVVGESADSGSDAKLGQVLRDAELANISIYTIGVTSIGLNTSANDILGGKLPPLKLSKHAPPISAQRPGAQPFGSTYIDFITPAIWLIERGTSEIKNHQLEVAVAATGGVHYRAFRDDTVRAALDKIGDELYAQYTMSYMPSADVQPGFREIKVTVARPGVTVRTRPGYYLAPPN